MKKAIVLAVLAALFVSGCAGSTTGRAPTAPSNLAAQAVSSTSIALTWQDNSSNENGFQIERSASSVGGFQVVGTQPSDRESYVDSGLNANTTYYYRVKAVNSNGESISNTASAKTSSAANVATLRVYNYTRYPVISVEVNTGSGVSELIASSYDAIPPGMYEDYPFNLSGSTATISYTATVGFWDSTNGYSGRFSFWNSSCALSAGQITTVSFNVSLAQVLSNFKTYSDWLGYYWYNGLMYYKFFRFYSNGSWQLYNNGTLVDSGSTTTLTQWNNYSDSIYFKLKPTSDAILLYYPSTKFYYNNGPAGWTQIEYVLQP